MKFKNNIKFMMLLLYLLLFIIFIEENEAYNATIAYRSNVSGGTDSPRIREWNSTGDGSYDNEVVLANSSSPLRQMVLRYNPVSSKRILVTLSDDGNLDAYVCKRFCNSSSSWALSSNIGTIWGTVASARAQRHFDVNFETLTGDAVVVYAAQTNDASRDLAFRVLPADNDTFTSDMLETSIDDPTATTDVQYTWVEMARNPGKDSQEMIVVGFDLNGSDINAWVWNGTNWTNSNSLTAAATATSGRKALSVGYAGNTSSCSNCTAGLAVGGDGTSGNVVGRLWTGSAWKTVIVGDMAAGTDDMQWLQLKSSPSPSDGKVLLYSQESGSDNQIAIWNGANWTLNNITDTTVDSLTSIIGDVALNSTDNGGFLAWETDGTGVSLHFDYCIFPDPKNYKCTLQLKNITSALPASDPGSLYNGTGAWVSLYTNPSPGDGVDVLGLRLNSNVDLFLFKKNATNVTNYFGGSVLTLNAGSITQQPFDLDFARVEENPPAKINLSNPLNATSNGTTTHIFRANASDNVNVSRAELWTDITGVFEKKQSQNLSGSGTYNLTEFTETSIAAGTYFWNVRFCDNSSNCEFYPVNYTFEVVVSNLAPSDANTTIRPVNPFRSDNLNCSWSYLDPNNDAGTGTIIWYNNSLEHFRVNITTPGNNTIVSYTLLRNATNIFSAGENWTCAGRANDGTINSANWVNASVLIGNTVPEILTVYNTSIQSITENTYTNITISFSISDVDGADTIGFNNSRLNLTKNGGSLGTPVYNYSSSTSGGCFDSGDINSTVANISCSVHVWYFLTAGEWNISVSYNDSVNFAQNITHNFTLSSTSAIQISPTNITYGGTIFAGGDNVTSDNDPIVVNNTGNLGITSGNVRATGRNLVGETTKTQYIPAVNFTVEAINSTTSDANAGCKNGNNATALTNGTAAGVTNTVLAIGNHSMNNGTSGIEHIFVCLIDVPLGLSAQAYSTLELGEWVVDVI